MVNNFEISSEQIVLLTNFRHIYCRSSSGLNKFEAEKAEVHAQNGTYYTSLNKKFYAAYL